MTSDQMGYAPTESRASTAFLIFRGSVVGSLLGITLAALNVVLALLSVGAYPIWSLLIIALDGVVIYALTAHGDAFATAG